MSSPIPYQPTPGLSYDPAEEHYWDPEALQSELTRTFEICHGCRMCFKYCDSFPTLFSLLDEHHDGNVRGITPSETKTIMDGCFQCKLCEVQCPYTVRDAHEFQLDFPKLVHRYRAQQSRGKRDSAKKRRQKWLLGNPDRTARLARTTLGLANLLNRRSKLYRRFLDVFAGIHPKKHLPSWSQRTFTSWAIHEGLTLPSDTGEAVLFPTCYVEHNEPQLGKDTVSVLQRNGIALTCETGLHCCGMPAWESGDLDTLRTKAKANLERLSPHVDAEKKVVVINPTCSMMLRREYPELVDPSDRNRARALADKVADPGELLWSIRNDERFDNDFASTPVTVSYHAPCHLRAQSVGFKGRDLLKKIPGLEVETTLQCSGHDGTFAMTTQGYEVSVRIGKKAFEGLASTEAEVWATDCPLAILQFAQHTAHKPMHPMSILAQAYEPDGFPTKVIPETPS